MNNSLIIIIFSLLAAANTPPEERPTTYVYPVWGHTLGFNRVSRKHLKIYFPRRNFDIKNPQGVAVTRLKYSDDPKTKDDDVDVTVYGVNCGEHIIIYNKEYTAATYGSFGKGEGEFAFPRGIAANPQGNVYVADTGNNRIVHLKNIDFELNYIKTFGQKDNLKQPRQVALDSRGNIYVTDSGNNCVRIYGTNGVVQKTIRNLSFPDGIAVMDRKERWSFYKDNFICVIDKNHSRINKYSLQGKLLGSMEASNLGINNPRLAYVAIDYYSNILITDTNNHTIHKLDRKLNYLTSFGGFGEGEGQFDSPAGIAIWRRFGMLFVTERESAQYYWVAVDLLNLKIDYRENPHRVEFTYFLTEPAFVTVKVYRGRKLIKPLCKRKKQFSGENYLCWWGRDKKARLVKPDRYTLKIEFEATYSSHRHFKKEIKKPFSWK